MFGSILPASPRCSVSKPTYHHQDLQRILGFVGGAASETIVRHQYYSMPLQGPWDRLQPSHAGWARPRLEVEIEGVQRRRAEALHWWKHMVSPLIPEPVGHLWMESLVKGRLCHRLQCGKAVSPRVFLAVLETAERTVNSWSFQNRLLPCRKPSVYPPS